MADNEAKHTRFSERLAHERSKRGEYDKELKQVEEEYGKAEKALDAASRKAEAAAAAMKELEQRDVKVRCVAGMNYALPGHGLHMWLASDCLRRSGEVGSTKNSAGCGSTQESMPCVWLLLVCS
jgi:hypothetical protein